MIKNWKVAVVVGILLCNFLLFVKYARNDGGAKDDAFAAESLSSALGEKKVRSAIIPQIETEDSVYPSLDIADHAPPLLFYNRVPKTGSTTFANIAYKLTKRNQFHMLHLNTTYKNFHYLNIIDQQRFVRNISLWKEKQPALYHGHLNYLDFTRFGYRNPVYINIVRDPIERLVSYYYFLRFGDDFRPKLVRARARDNKTLDECLVQKGWDCDFSRVLWVQIPFFCGQAQECLYPGRWALERAKTNLLDKYLLVGITEQLEDFIAVLEAMLPRFFSGALDLYTKTELGHLRKTAKKLELSKSSLRIIKESKIYKLEAEFYEFAKEHFSFLLQRSITRNSKGQVMVSRPGFKFEKIFPQEKPP